MGIFLKNQVALSMNQRNEDQNNSAQDLLNQIVIEHFKEKKQQHKRRLWRRILWVVVAVVGVFYFFTAHKADIAIRTAPHVGVIDIKGEIFDTQAANADNLTKSLQTAYASTGLKAIIYRIDSPGGSPVQADYMFNTIRYYHDKYPKSNPMLCVWILVRPRPIMSQQLRIKFMLTPQVWWVRLGCYITALDL